MFGFVVGLRRSSFEARAEALVVDIALIVSTAECRLRASGGISRSSGSSVRQLYWRFYRIRVSGSAFERFSTAGLRCGDVTRCRQ
jgi:hypothetical protein